MAKPCLRLFLSGKIFSCIFSLLYKESGEKFLQTLRTNPRYEQNKKFSIDSLGNVCARARFDFWNISHSTVYNTVAVFARDLAFSPAVCNMAYRLWVNFNFLCLKNVATILFKTKFDL